MALFSIAPGLAVCGLIVGASVLLEWQTGIPALVTAIGLGIPVSAFWAPAMIEPGIKFASDTLLKTGIICLGAGLSFVDVKALGAMPLVVAIIAVALCIALALVVAYASGRLTSYGLVTGGGVGICGTAAIAALGACVPRGALNITDAEIAICIVVVTLLSAVGVIVYPQIAVAFQLNPTETGMFLGGTIHGVGQAIAAGHAQSPETAAAATITKLLRVSLLVPLVLAACIMRLGSSTKIIARLPLFLGGFVLLMGARSYGLIPDAGITFAAIVAKLCLLIAMAGLGLKTRIADLKQASPGLPILLTGYSLVLLVAILAILLLNRTFL